MTQGPSCLADRELEEFLVGALARDEAEAVRHHVSSCRRCQELMVRISDDVATSRSHGESQGITAAERETSSAVNRLQIPGYEILRELGRGGMGVVYEAFDQARNARVALKTIRKKDAAALYRFKQEFRAVANLSHPNLIPLHELSATGNEWYFTMPIVEGVRLPLVRAAGSGPTVPPV